MSYGVVYVIRNLVNGKSYVGQTTQPAEERFRQHRSRINTSHCKALSAAISKHGVESFEFSVATEVDSKEKLDAVEVEFILRLGSMSPGGYNLKAGGSFGTHGPESREKISRGNRGKERSEEYRAAASARMIGTSVPEETRIKISATLLGKNYVNAEARAVGAEKRRGRRHTEESKAKMSTNRSGIRVSEEMKARLSAANLGKKHSPETRARMSERQRERHAARKEAGLSL